MGPEGQGWVAHFVRSALRDEEITLFGDGRQVRDVMHVRHAAAAYILAMRAMPRVAGEAFNLGGGSANAVSLIQILHEMELLTGRAVRLRIGEWRPGARRGLVVVARKVDIHLYLQETLQRRT